MRRPVQIALVTVLVLLAGGSALLFSKYRSTHADYLAVKASEESAKNRYAETIDAIAEIQDSLGAISLGETDVRMGSSGLRAEQSLGARDSREALDRIAELRASILRSRDRIRTLEDNLRASGIRVAGLQKMIGRLKATATEKEALVARLSGRVDSLETEVTGLVTVVQQTQDTVRVRDQALEERRRELATVYYVVGTRKELTDAGVVQARGGVLGIGKTLSPAGNPNPAVFVPVDTDHQSVIRTGAPKAKVLSAQPHSSYEMIVQDGQVVVHILDPEEFRKVRQLVILTG